MLFRLSLWSADTCGNEWATEGFTPVTVEASSRKYLEKHLPQDIGMFQDWHIEELEPVSIDEFTARWDKKLSKHKGDK